MAFDTWNSEKYESILNALVQEKGPKLMDSVMVSYGFNDGEYKYVNQVGSVDFDTVTDRLGDTQWDEMDRYRRRISKQYFDKAFLFDNFEELNTNVDPTSKTTSQLLMAYGRKVDAIIIAAANDTAYAGKQGGTPTTLASYSGGGHVIAHGGTNMTVDKMLEVKRKFGLANVDGDYDKLTWVISPYETEALLNLTEVKNSDYNTTKALAGGKVNSFMGFDWRESNQLSISSNVTTTLVYAKSGIELAIAKGFELSADRIPTKRNAVGFQAQCAMGATRLEEAKVITVGCDHS